MRHDTWHLTHDFFSSSFLGGGYCICASILHTSQDLVYSVCRSFVLLLISKEFFQSYYTVLVLPLLNKLRPLKSFTSLLAWPLGCNISPHWAILEVHLIWEVMKLSSYCGAFSEREMEPQDAIFGTIAVLLGKYNLWKSVNQS